MIINLENPREQYFENPSVTDILRQFVDKDGPITISDIRQLGEEQRLTVGTKDGDLTQLLDRQHAVDSFTLPEKVRDSKKKLLVLPPEYRIPAGEVRNVVAYSLDSLVLLDSVEVIKKVLKREIVPRGPLSAKRKQQEEWSPERVVKTAFTELYRRRGELAEQTISCYSWWGKDKHRRIVSLYRAIQGAELRAFQDYVAFRLLIPTYRKELRTGFNARTRKPLLEQERVERTEKIRKYSNYLQRNPVGRSIRKLDVEFTDLIEPLGRFAYGTGQRMRVPSRSKIGQDFYKLKLTDIPLLEPNDPLAYSLVWDLAGNCHCEDKSYRSDRRKQAPGRGTREDFFCPHEISALHTLRKKYENDSLTIPFLPFVLPTKEMMDYVDMLRYQTVMLTQSDSGRWSKRSLNHTEIENLLWKKVMRDGYAACFTTDISTFKQQGYDPHLDLVKFAA